jgi:hypothetical protein
MIAPPKIAANAIRDTVMESTAPPSCSIRAVLIHARPIPYPMVRNSARPAERVDNAGFPGMRVLAECKSTKATHKDVSSLLAGSFS